MTELWPFDGLLCPPYGIFPNLPIELGNKIVFINVVVMIGLMNYNIVLGHDYIYAMNVTDFYVLLFNK